MKAATLYTPCRNRRRCYVSSHELRLALAFLGFEGFTLHMAWHGCPGSRLNGDLEQLSIEMPAMHWYGAAAEHRFAWW